MADKRFETFRLDVGVEGHGTVQAEAFTGRDFLAFADVAPVEHQVISLPQHMAEKIHAYTRIYSQARKSSRDRDLVDLVLVCHNLTMSAGTLITSLQSTFRVRGLQTIPLEFPRPPQAWVVPYRSLAQEVGIEPRLEAGWDAASAFLNPVLGGEVAPDAVWSPDDQRWVVR